MKTLPASFELDRYHISPGDVTQMVFHCDPERIQPDVILMPWWQPEIFTSWADRITTLTPNNLFEMEYRGKFITVIRSGIGAPQTGDVVLALGCTACQRILFAGSVGGLHPEMKIGDLMMPTFSYCGDGFSRYLNPEFPKNDCFLEQTSPDEALAMAVAQTAGRYSEEAGIRLHRGPVFSIDTILAQFGKLEYIANELGCMGIEMETSAVFKAARLLGIQAAALLSVSDVPVRSKTLYAGRSLEEKNFRKEIRSRILARVLLDVIG